MDSISSKRNREALTFSSSIPESSGASHQDYLTELTGWNYYGSRLFAKNLEERYSSEFWDSYWSNLKEWIYLVAYRRHREIKGKLEEVNGNAEQRIRSYMKTGEWTRQGFDEYLNLLFDYFG